IDAHETAFPALAARVRDGLNGGTSGADVAIVNLNRRSLLSDGGDPNKAVFDRMIARMTDPDLWRACEDCALAAQCYARHNARTFNHASLGTKISARLRMLYRLTELRGTQHITVRDVQSALAFMLTSGRNCAQIHDLYAGDHV